MEFLNGAVRIGCAECALAHGPRVRIYIYTYIIYLFLVEIKGSEFKFFAQAPTGLGYGIKYALWPLRVTCTPVVVRGELYTVVHVYTRFLIIWPVRAAGGGMSVN